MLFRSSLEDCYVKPTIVSTDKRITSAMREISTYLQAKITYQIGTETEVIDKSLIGPALVIDSEYRVTLDESKVKEFLEDLGKKYNSTGGTWEFATSYDTVVTIQGGDYGWTLDEEQELEEVLPLIKEGERCNRDPLGIDSKMPHTNVDIGDTYVEINITKQHM